MVDPLGVNLTRSHDFTDFCLKICFPFQWVNRSPVCIIWHNHVLGQDIVNASFVVFFFDKKISINLALRRELSCTIPQKCFVFDAGKYAIRKPKSQNYTTRLDLNSGLITTNHGTSLHMLLQGFKDWTSIPRMRPRCHFLFRLLQVSATWKMACPITTPLAGTGKSG